MSLFTFSVISLLPLVCIDGQSWTKCTKSSNWKISMTPDLVMETRNEAECIWSCVSSGSCNAVRFDLLSRTCGHYNTGRLSVVNGTAYETVAFIRNIEGTGREQILRAANKVDPTKTARYSLSDLVTISQWIDRCIMILNQNTPRYMYTFEKAKTACNDLGGSLMTEQQLDALQQAGYQKCVCAWLSENKRMYPMQVSAPSCGSHIGLVTCNHFTTADAWCVIT